MTTTKTYCTKTANISVLTDGRIIFNGLFLRDIDEETERIGNIENHIEADDYFGSLATIIDLIEQRADGLDPLLRQTLDNLKGDLIYLQEKYRIVKK
jgi:hypothetical protein